MSFDGKRRGGWPVNPSELLRHLTATFDDLGIRYFITGSVATTMYGEPRMTQDVDVVADLGMGQIKAFRRHFPEESFYLSDDAMREAIAHAGQFSIIDMASGFKADVMVAERSRLNESRFKRRRQLRVEGEDRDYCFSSPEDVILKKMEFYAEGESDKHLRDIRGILKMMGETLDRACIDEWAAKLRLADIWQAVQEP